MPEPQARRAYDYVEMGLMAGGGSKVQSVQGRLLAAGSRALSSSAAGGSWRVIGISGAVAVHLMAFTNSKALVIQRPDLQNPNPYLQVSCARVVIEGSAADTGYHMGCQWLPPAI